MKCVKCSDIYCYVYGLSEKDCYKEDSKGDIFSHNREREREREIGMLKNSDAQCISLKLWK